VESAVSYRGEFLLSKNALINPPPKKNKQNGNDCQHRRQFFCQYRARGQFFKQIFAPTGFLKNWPQFFSGNFFSSKFFATTEKVSNATIVSKFQALLNHRQNKCLLLFKERLGANVS
jgi:hypothetical protein